MSLDRAKYGFIASVVAVACVFGLGRLKTARAEAAVREPLAIADTSIRACPHTDGSIYDCGPSSAMFVSDAATIEGVTLTIKFKGGATQTVNAGARTDAIFLTSGAVKNFLLRYYSATGQKGKVKTLTNDLKTHGGYATK